MAVSYDVFLPENISIDVKIISRRATSIIKNLLCLNESFQIELNFGSSGGELSFLMPDDKLIEFIEARYLNAGALVSYGKDPFWRERQKGEAYLLSVLEVPVEKNSLLLLVCMAIALAIAVEYGDGTFRSDSGVWGDAEEFDYFRIANMANREILPLDEALEEFFKRIVFFQEKYSIHTPRASSEKAPRR